MNTRSTTQAFLHDRTRTLSYVLSDDATRRAAVVDSVLDYDPASRLIATTSCDEVLAYLAAQSLQLDWILETHPHADHLSGARYLRERAGGRIAIGAGICAVQALFQKLHAGECEVDFATDGSQFDHLFQDDEVFRIGELEARALHVPGHTPADLAYLIDDKVFVGDTLFMPDAGSARTDFPGGDARRLHRSIQRLLDLPLSTVIYVCHDYPTPLRAAAWRTTVADQRAFNVHARIDVSEDAFVAMRRARDAILPVPALLMPSLRVNLRAGCWLAVDGT